MPDPFALPAISRRDFIAATAAATAACVQGCSTGTTSIKPGIIDTHTHFYDPTRPGGVPWPPKDDPILYRRVLPSDFFALAAPLGVTGTVVVEASPLEEDNQWVLDLLDKDPRLLGLVGHLKPGKPGFEAHLKRFSRHPKFRGIRAGGWDGPLDPAHTTTIQHLKQLAEWNLSLDVLIGPAQLPQIAQIAATVPNLRILINHIANVPVDGNTPPLAWKDGLRACASHPNVACKVSALVEGTGRTHQDAPRDLAYYRPVLDWVWDCFGEDRVIYGSNWPVSERFANYATVLNLVQTYFGEMGSRVLHKFLQGNARRYYRV